METNVEAMVSAFPPGSVSYVPKASITSGFLATSA
jgi:hypothetical protein